MAPMIRNFRFVNSDPGAINSPLPIAISPVSRSSSTSLMAGHRSRWINWDALGDEAEEDSAELNYDYEWLEPGFPTLIHLFCNRFFIRFAICA